MPDPTAPRPDVPDELRERLLAADLTNHKVTNEDGYASTVGHSSAEAVDRALAVFDEWLPEIKRRFREQVAAEISDPSVWPDPMGLWTADQADAARAMKAHIRRHIAPEESSDA